MIDVEIVTQSALWTVLGNVESLARPAVEAAGAGLDPPSLVR